MDFPTTTTKIWVLAYYCNNADVQDNLPTNPDFTCVLVYSSISIDGCTDFYIIRDGPLTAHRYREEILRPIVVPYAAAIGDDFILMDDNSRPHRANLVEDFLFEEGIVRMEWPACSPDMDPIEHVWDALGRRVAGRQPPPTHTQLSKNWKELFWKSGTEYPNS
ncbi:transposable element Tcb2 transposase [Trichonephila clavipes]|nr:transposable element Tcb2 transposase [Trichonephila clavipes]